MPTCETAVRTGRPSIAIVRDSTGRRQVPRRAGPPRDAGRVERTRSRRVAGQDDEDEGRVNARDQPPTPKASILPGSCISGSRLWAVSQFERAVVEDLPPGGHQTIGHGPGTATGRSDRMDAPHRRVARARTVRCGHHACLELPVTRVPDVRSAARQVM